MIAGVLTALLLAGATAVALGPPDLALARAFLSGDRPTEEAQLATAEAVFWLTLLLLTVTVTVRAWRRGRLSAPARNRSLRAAVVAGIGAVALAAGILQHRPAPYPICCGDSHDRVQEARRLAR